MTLTKLSGPDHEALSLPEVKQRLHIIGNDDDADLLALIMSAREQLEGDSGYLGRCLLSQTWSLDLEKFVPEIRVPLPPLQMVTAVQYYNEQDVLTTVTTTVYEEIRPTNSWGCIRLLGNQDWPTDISATRSEPVKITFKAGYGDDWNAVPYPIRQAMLISIGQAWLHREGFVEGAITHLPITAEKLLGQYRMERVG
jgi:uncharacterized phiE125 gp8 family phage protein